MKFISRCAATSSGGDRWCEWEWALRHRHSFPLLNYLAAHAERLSGIRCLAVQSQAPDTASLVAMVRQRLDALVVLNSDGKGSAHPRNGAGQIKAAYLAHLVPDVDQPWTVSSPLSLDELTEEDFDDLVHEWETELRAAGFALTQLQSVAPDHDRVLLVGLITEDITEQQFQDGLAELARKSGKCWGRSRGNHPAEAIAASSSNRSWAGQGRRNCFASANGGSECDCL